jgi:hypothetical protein
MREASAGVGYFSTAIAAHSRHNRQSRERPALGIRWVEAFFSVLVARPLGEGNSPSRAGIANHPKDKFSAEAEALIEKLERVATDYEACEQSTMLSPQACEIA